MIQTGSKLRVVDNSGAKNAICIKVLGGFKRRYAKSGDKIVVSISSLRSKRRSQAKIQKGKITYAIVIQTKQGFSRLSKISYRFFENTIVLINNQGKPLGTRIIGGIPRQIRYTKYMRLTTIATGILK